MGKDFFPTHKIDKVTVIRASINMKNKHCIFYKGKRLEQKLYKLEFPNCQ